VKIADIDEDGGGIQGYSSLLILKALMTKIRDLEEAEARRVSGQSNGRNIPARINTRPLPSPCHYFDYIFGTSTGGY